MSTQYDHYLTTSQVAALTIREPLVPAEGPGAVVFPSTYASGEGFRGGYNIDSIDKDGRNVCLIDSIGSQSNRIEPLFMSGEYAKLVPQIVVEAGEKKINLLEAGHRAGDAIVRCSELQETLQNAFKAALAGDCEPLAKIAPTSLVFGVWDSRDTGAKVPRVVASTIRAYDVRELRRSAQYFPATKYVSEGLMPDHKGDKKKKDQYAERGFVEVPATATHGGVIAEGGIRRDATLALAALRLLKAGTDEAKTLKLRRYIFGLALVAFTAPIENYLRQGCLLVGDPESPRQFNEVQRNGERTEAAITHEQALAFAQVAAKEFGVGESQTVPFDRKKAEADLKKKDAQSQD